MTDYSGWCVYGDISTDHKSANRIELLGGLSVNLNHLIASHMANYD